VASPLCVNTVYKEWVKSQTQLYYYYYVAIWWKVANNYMFRP